MSVLCKLTCGLYVVTTAYDGVNNGCVINTATQVTSEPQKIAVTLSKNNLTTGMIRQSGFFAAAVLTQKAPMEQIGRFGFRTGRNFDKFAGHPYETDGNGAPYVTENIAALLSCKVDAVLDLGTHTMFIGLLTGEEELSDDPVMTYDYYHSVIKGKTPPNAPSYQARG